MDIDGIEKSCEIGHKSIRIGINFNFYHWVYCFVFGIRSDPLNRSDYFIDRNFEGSTQFICEWSKLNGKLVVISIFVDRSNE